MKILQSSKESYWSGIAIKNSFKKNAIPNKLLTISYICTKLF